MVRQDPGVQHIGIAQHKLGLRLDASSLRRRRVAVADAWGELIAQLFVAGEQFQQALELILRQRLGGVEVQCSRVAFCGGRFENRQVVAKRFATAGAGDDDEIASRRGGVAGGRLVAIQIADRTPGKQSGDSRRERALRRGEAAGPCGRLLVVRQTATILALQLQATEQGVDIHGEANLRRRAIPSQRGDGAKQAPGSAATRRLRYRRPTTTFSLSVD